MNHNHPAPHQPEKESGCMTIDGVLDKARGGEKLTFGEIVEL